MIIVVEPYERGRQVIRKIANRIRNSIWLYPAIYSVGALLLSVLISYVDQHFTEVLADYIPGLLYTNTAFAQMVLGIIAGAFITIATFTFSTAMVVLTMYSSQFTPRVVENFLNNETTMKSFGVFLSGFIFSITSLLLIRSDEQGSLVISASVGVLYIIVGLIYFLIFINNVSMYIQASGLILRLHDEALKRIRQYRDFLKKSEIISEEELKKIVDSRDSVDVFSQADGYIQEIDFMGMKRISKEHNCVVCVKKVVGQFISRETRVATIYQENPEDAARETAGVLQQFITAGNKRTEAQDFSFTIQKIVEIALKALSPGINDPNTAIHCLKIIGLLLRDLSDIRNGYVVLSAKGDDDTVVCEAYDFEVLLHDAYQQIAFYGKFDASVMTAVFKSLRFAKAKASEGNLLIIDDYARMLFERPEGKNYNPLSFRKFEKEYVDLIAYRKASPVPETV